MVPKKWLTTETLRTLLLGIDIDKLSFLLLFKKKN
jgi:hypothetical protein